MKIPIAIHRTPTSKVTKVDVEQSPLGTVFTDHMFICEYADGMWKYPRIEPLAMIPTHPAAMALHYGQAIFEGMKAVVNTEGVPVLFRPEANALRFNNSAARMGMPTIDPALFVAAVRQFVGVEHAWIPKQRGSALYVRPFMYADEPFIGMRAATRYKFMIIATPAQPLFSKKIRLLAETNYIRAAQGGTGAAKAAGNYAAAILPTEEAKRKQFDQLLWLDAEEHRYIQEVGTMNIFFKIAGKVITPAITGTILAGITRDSVLTLLKDRGVAVEERPIAIDELLQAARDGVLEEAFGTGTAAGITIIDQIQYKDEVLQFPPSTPVATAMLQQLEGIKTQEQSDSYGWVVPADTSVQEDVSSKVYTHHS